MISKIIGADPNVMFDPISGLFYCYATKDEYHLHFEILESKDLINWKMIGYAIDDRDKNNWCSDWFWAPECYYNPNNGYYYLFYSAKVLPSLVEEYFHNRNYDECCKIGVAISKSPKGPFKNITNRPLDYYPYDPSYLNVDAYYKNIFLSSDNYKDMNNSPKGEYLSMIDVNLFIDEDKCMYLFFSRCCYHNATYDNDLNKFIEESNICAVELDIKWWYSPTPTMPQIKTEYMMIKNDARQDLFKSIITYHNDPQDWENGHINDYEKYGKHNRRWSEGSTTFFKYINNEKIYCITYSCNNYENELYGVGIAFSKSPLGPYKKYLLNPIISKNNKLGVVSTGHGSIVDYNGKTFYLHHGRNNPNEERSLFLTEIKDININKVGIGNIVQCNLINK